MPEEENKKPSEKTVDIDTSGPEVDVAVEEQKDESVIETKEETSAPEQEQETVKEIKKEQKEDDSKLEDYSKGVQSRIAKLTRKMREAERRESAAIEYAQSLENRRKLDQERFQKVDADYTKDLKKVLKVEWKWLKNNWPKPLKLEMHLLKLKQTNVLQNLRLIMLN